jgi:hypothetical protein
MAQRLVTGVAIAAAVWFGWRYFFPNDEAQIRSVLERIADGVASGAAEQGEVARIARAASIRNELDPKVTVDAGPPFSPMIGRDTLVATVARLNSTVPELEVEFEDAQVTVAPDRSTARVHVTAVARFRDERGGRGLEARVLDVLFRRLDGEWVVSEVAARVSLEPMTR